MSSDTSDTTEQTSDDQPTGKRWDPLGANDMDNQIETIGHNFDSVCLTQCFPYERVRALEEEQELLNASLFQLTTHFAQVQFRLRQVVDAPTTDKEHLLKSLEEFAFRGVSDTCSIPCMSQDCADRNDVDRLTQRHKQLELIEQLKSQLTELETYTFVSGNDNSCIPEYMLQRQRSLIDELKYKINTTDDRSEGDGASAMTPVKMKEQLVSQFKTQIADLERFIQFLQEGTQQSDNASHQRCNCSCPVHGSHVKTIGCQFSRSGSPFYLTGRNAHDAEVRNRTIGIMKRAATLLQMFIVMQFGCGREQFKRNNLKPCFNHWGDLRARLEVSVTRVEELIKNRTSTIEEYQGEYLSDTEGTAVVSCNVHITSAVRKHLASAVRDLIQHGLNESIDRTSVVPFITCFPTRTVPPPKQMHAWELILQYYHLKNGETYNSTPARKLSQSFNLEIAGGNTITNKQNMLSIIGSIMATHSAYKRSYDAHFKAFICAALNYNKLVIWLSLILQSKQLINHHYNSWSYVVRTGFKDSLQSLDRLTAYQFDLPVDLAVRHFQNIKDVFM